MRDPPLDPALVDLFTRLRVANQRKRLDEAIQRITHLEQRPLLDSPPSTNEDPTE